MTLDAVVLDHQPIPVLNEFALRGLKAGFTDPSDLSGLLGLEEGLMTGTLGELFRLDQIDYPVEVGGSRSLRITGLGRQTLDALEETQPERREIWFAFDRLLWRPVGHHVASLIKPAELNDLDMLELRPRRVARPVPDELDLPEVSKVLSHLSARRTPTVLAIRRLLRAERRYLPSHLLIFQSEDGRDTEVSLAIDGHLSEPHEQALIELGGAEFLRLESAEPSSERVDLSEVAGAGASSPDPESVMNLDEIRRLRKATEPPDIGDSSEGPERPLGDLTPDSARETIDTASYREIDTYEHAQFFRTARRETRKRLLIISPWVSGAVVNSAFLKELRRLASRKIEIAIGYGITRDEVRSERDQHAEDQLEKLARQFPNVAVARLGDTHAKVLISDTTLIVSSFNWLSFRGDRGRTYRQERGLLIKDPAFVDRSFEEHRERILGATS
jgi:hypothetical protein